MASRPPDPEEDQESPQSKIDSLIAEREEEQGQEPQSRIDSLIQARQEEREPVDLSAADELFREPGVPTRFGEATPPDLDPDTIRQRRDTLRRRQDDEPDPDVMQDLAEGAILEESDLDFPELPAPTEEPDLKEQATRPYGPPATMEAVRRDVQFDPDFEPEERTPAPAGGRLGLGVGQAQEQVDEAITTPEERLRAVHRATPGMQWTEAERLMDRRRRELRRRTLEQMTPGERFQSAANSFMRGITGLGSSSLRQVAVLAKGLDNVYRDVFDADGSYKGEEVEELATYRASEAVREFAEEQFPEDERLQGAFLETVLPRALGSGVGFLMGGAGARALKMSSLGFSGTVGALAEGGAMYREARESGATHDEAMEVSIKTMPLGALEAIPAELQLRRLFRAAGGNRGAIARAIFAGGTEETAQETVQSIGGNILAKRSFDPDRGITEGLGQTIAAAFITGGVLSGGAQITGSTLRRAEQRLQEDRESDTPRPLTRAIEAGQRRIATFIDPSMQEEMEELREQAETDPLTGLPNRRGEERLREERRAPAPNAEEVVLEADLDNFKAINDNMGEEAGDDALVTVADALREATREQDQLGQDIVALARQGGDEFRITLQLPQGQDSTPIARRIENTVNQRLEEAGYAQVAGSEVGISVGEDVKARKAERGVSIPREVREAREIMGEQFSVSPAAQHPKVGPELDERPLEETNYDTEAERQAARERFGGQFREEQHAVNERFHDQVEAGDVVADDMGQSWYFDGVVLRRLESPEEAGGFERVYQTREQDGQRVRTFEGDVAFLGDFTVHSGGLPAQAPTTSPQEQQSRRRVTDLAPRSAEELEAEQRQLPRRAESLQQEFRDIMDRARAEEGVIERQTLAQLSEGTVEYEDLPAETQRMIRGGRGQFEERFNRLPNRMWHVTTDMESVAEEGLKSRRELQEERGERRGARGRGLGGGSDLTISFAAEPEVADNIASVMLEARDVAAGEITMEDLLEMAEAGEGANRPFAGEAFKGMWLNYEAGEPLPDDMRREIHEGVMTRRSGIPKTPETAADSHMLGPEWVPIEESEVGNTGQYQMWQKEATEQERRERRFEMYKRFLQFRDNAGGPSNPVFFTSDVEGLAETDPENIGVIEVRPANPNAKGLQMRALSEYRVFSGDAIEVTNIEPAMEGVEAPTRTARAAPADESEVLDYLNEEEKADGAPIALLPPGTEGPPGTPPTGDVEGGIMAEIPNKGINFRVDRGIARHIGQINALGFETNASDSGLAADHPNVRGHGPSSAYLSFVTSDEREREIIREAARDAGFVAEPEGKTGPGGIGGGAAYFADGVIIRLPRTNDGSPSWEIVEESNREAKRRLGVDPDRDMVYNLPEDVTFDEYLDLRNEIQREEVYPAHGGSIEMSDEEIHRRWDALVENLREAGEALRSERQTTEQAEAEEAVQTPDPDIQVEGGERGERPPVPIEEEGVGERGELWSTKVFALRNEDILYQPERMQFKVRGKAARGELLEDVEEWDPDFGSVLSVWFDENAENPRNDLDQGSWVVVNGHNRLQLARDLDVDRLNVMEIEADNEAQARQKGALMNITEGRGTVFDAARFFRNADLTEEDLRALGVPLTEHKVQQGRAISNLAQPLFDAYRRQELPVQRAALIGESDLTEAQQIDLWELIQESGRLRNDEIRAMIRRAGQAETTTSEQETLFGTEQVEQTNLKEQGIVEAYVSRKLARQARTFQFASKDDRAEMLERANVGEINPERAAEVGEKAAQIQEVFEKLATRSGTEINQIIQDQATRLAEGEEDADTIKQDAFKRATEALRRFVEGGLAEGGGRRGETVEGGRTRTGPARGAATAAEGGTNEFINAPFVGLPERQQAREEIARGRGATFRVQGVEVALRESFEEDADELTPEELREQGRFDEAEEKQAEMEREIESFFREGEVGQEDAFAGTAPAEGGDQFGFGLSEERDESLEATRDRAEQTVDRLRPVVEDGDPSLTQLQKYRDALRVLTEGEGRTEELQQVEQRIQNRFQEGGRPEEAGFADIGGQDRGLVSIELGDKGQEIADILAGGKQRVGSFFRRWFTFHADLPPDAAERNVSRENAVKAEIMEANQAVRDFLRALRDNGYIGRTGIPGMPQEQVEALNDALHGQYERAPADIRSEIKKMRNHVDRLSHQLIESGLTEGELEMTIRENLGVYLHRSYRIFDDPQGWREDMPQNVYNQAVNWMREYILANDQQGVLDSDLSLDEMAQGRVEELLVEKEQHPLEFFTSGQLGAKNFAIFKERQDIPDPIRALWGEYSDPRVNYVRSVSNMIRLLENHRFLQDIKTMGRDQGWLRSPQQGPSPEINAVIAAEGSEVMSPLNGWYTTEAIRDAWQEVANRGAGVDNLIGRWYMKALAIVKGGKTVGSLQTHVRNFVSAASALIANGNFLNVGIEQVKTATGVGTVEVGPVERVYQKLGGEQATIEDWRRYLRDAVRHGVAHQSARGGEMQDIFEDAHLGGDLPMPSDAVLRQTRKAVRTGLRETTNAYQAEDDFWKILSWEAEQAKIRDALGENPSDAELRAYAEEIGFNPQALTVKEIAASITRNTVPTYSRVSRAIRTLRRSPVFSSFPSFFAEIFRTGRNMLALTSRELRSGIPGARKNGIKRAAGLLTVAALGNVIASMSRWLWDIDDEADQDLRWFVPPWSEHSAIAYLGRNAKGHLQWIDLGYSDFYAVFREPVMALLAERKDWDERLYDAFDAATDAFTSAEILTQAAVEVWTNHTQSGGRVRNPEASFFQQAGSVLGHLWEAFEPGTVRSIMRIRQGLEGEVTDYGREYDPWIEILAMMTGQRISPINIPQALTFNARDLERRQVRARRILNSPLSNRGEVSNEELRDAYVEAERTLREVYEKGHKQAQAAMRQDDLEPDRVKAIFARNGWSKSDASMIVEGRYKPYRPSFQFFQSLAKDLDADPQAGAEQIARLRQRFEFIQSLADGLPDELVWDEESGEWVPAE